MYKFLSRSFENASEMEVFLDKEVNNFIGKGFILENIEYHIAPIDLPLGTLAIKKEDTKFVRSYSHIIHVRLKKI